MFEGTYYKHQKDDNTFCCIAGRANSGVFLQVIVNNKVYQFDTLAGFSADSYGLTVKNTILQGRIYYSNLTPLPTDIMGPFRFPPFLRLLPCRHHVISMRHKLAGSILAEGQLLDFYGGIGYIEGDSGKSFPPKYYWVHSNDFTVTCSIMVSVAKIPLFKGSFWGCLGAVYYKGTHYRFATYTGAKIISASKSGCILCQGKYRLCIALSGGQQLPLKAPENGQMTGIIHESNSVKAQFSMYYNEELLFSLNSRNTSFECNL